jgi:methylated-DNA-[protein]-cysteine S-methyltransferase
MTYFYSTFSLSLESAPHFSVAVDAEGAVVGTAFGNVQALQRRLLLSRLIERAEACAHVQIQVLEYERGERTHFDLPLAPIGSDFQLRVWQALREIPFGETRSYGQLATALGSAARAVGRANATNPICLIVPCHRVIGADGSLTGFAFGEPVKRELLDLEGGVAKRATPASLRSA